MEESHAAPPALELRRLRLLSIKAHTHGYVWHKGSSIPAHKFSVGDYGYIPPGQDWDGFVVLGNILRDNLATSDIQRKSFGSQWCWKAHPMQRSDLHGFDLANDVKCWPVAVPAGQQIDCQVVHQEGFTRMDDAWEFLLNNGVELGRKWDVPPESLILIAQAGTDQAFYINDFGGGMRHSFPRNEHRGQFFRESFSGPLPRIMYLSTSHRGDFEPCWTQTPSPPSSGTTLESGWTYSISWKTGFINWVQLYREDFRPPTIS